LIKEDVIQLNLFSKDLVEIENQGERYVLCTNPILEQEHAQTRSSLKLKFEESLHEIMLSYQSRKSKNLINKKRLANGDKNKKLVCQFSEKQLDGYKYRVRKAQEKYQMQSFFEVLITNEDFNVQFKLEKYSQARQLDGKYVIVTNVSPEKMTKETIRKEYKNLKHVEHAFRDMKTVKLDIRPIFHVNENTTRGHVFVTMFAYAIVRELEKKIFPWLKLKNKEKKENLSFHDIEEELKMIKLNVLKIGKNHEEIMITELTNHQKEILSILNIGNEFLVA
jgi:transposase